MKISELEGHCRLDAEYYQPYYLDMVRRSEEFKSLAEYGTLILHPMEVKRSYQQEGLRILLAQSIRRNYLDLSHEGFLPLELEPRIRRNMLQNGDVVVTRSGANFGDAAVYQGTPRKIYASADCLIVRPQDIPGGYLSTYFNTSVGRALLLRGGYGAAQPHIAPDYIRTIRIPRDWHVEQIAEQKLRESKTRFEESDALYAQAQALLAAALGLDKMDLSESLYSVRRVSDVHESDRADAEYFQPKYQRAMERMERSGRRISDVVHLAKRRFKPQPQKPFRYIEIGNLTGEGHAESETIMGEDAPSRAQWVVKAGDVITSTVRPIRRLSALIEAEQDGSVCSSGFVVLEPIDVEPEVLLLYLRLPVVCEILDLHTTASMYPASTTT